MVSEVEALVVDPARAGLGERNLRDALPVARHQAEARLDVSQQPLVWVWLPGEDQRPRHVHVRGRILQLQERCVERTEPVFGHLSPAQGHRAPRCSLLLRAAAHFDLVEAVALRSLE